MRRDLRDNRRRRNDQRRDNRPRDRNRDGIRDRDGPKDEIRAGIFHRSDRCRRGRGRLDHRRGCRRLDHRRGCGRFDHRRGCRRRGGDRSRRRSRSRRRGSGRRRGSLLQRDGSRWRRNLDRSRRRRELDRSRRLGDDRRRRRRLDHRRRRRNGRRRRPRRRRGERRQEAERVEIALRLSRRTDTEMQIRLVKVQRAAWADRAKSVTFRHSVVLVHRVRPEVRERHGQPAGGLDRHRLAVRRHRPCVADDAARRCDHGDPGRRRADVDAAVLTAGVRMRGIEREALQHRTGDRPRPGVRARNPEDEEEEERNEPTHGAPPLLSEVKTKRAR